MAIVSEFSETSQLFLQGVFGSQRMQRRKPPPPPTLTPPFLSISQWIWVVVLLPFGPSVTQAVSQRVHQGSGGAFLGPALITLLLWRPKDAQSGGLSCHWGTERKDECVLQCVSECVPDGLIVAELNRRDHVTGGVQQKRESSRPWLSDIYSNTGYIIIHPRAEIQKLCDWSKFCEKDAGVRTQVL